MFKVASKVFSQAENGRKKTLKQEYTAGLLTRVEEMVLPPFAPRKVP